MKRLLGFAIAGAAIALLALPGTAQAQIGPGPFAAFPTEVENDGRFLAFGCSGLATLEEPVSISLTVPADATQFDLSFFDGETGRPDAANRPHWDLGTRQLSYSLYADPLLSADQSMLIGRWFGNDPNPISGPLWTASAVQMPDNDWWGVTVQTDPSAKAPSGRYFYNLVIDFVGTCNPGETTESSVKIAASAPMSFLVPQFGLVAGLRQLFNDGPIIYPGTFPPPSFVNAPTTYDGTFEFFFTVAPGAEDLRIFGGDFDRGATAGLAGLPSGTVLDPCPDTNDPDTPDDYFGFPFFAGNANNEGAVLLNAPADDSNFDAFRRGEPGAAGRVGCVRYEVIDPNGVVYRNDNPSGDREWEQFRIATQLAVNPNDADYGPAVAEDGVTFVTGDFLPAGSWKMRIVGLDLANLNVLVLATCANQLDPATGETISACLVPTVYLGGDTVWYDDNENGIQDAGEEGIPGVVVNLYDDSGSGIPVATAVTGDASDPNWTECLVNNTGLDTLGLYCFGVDEPGVYTVGIDPSNFGPGGALESLVSTTGGEQLTFEVIDDNVLTYDFGYVAPPPPPVVIGDTVWLDPDQDGAQSAGEAGISGVTVELLDGDGNVLATAVTGDSSDPNWATCQAVNTGLDEAGLYCFVVATGFDYTVRVAASNFEAGGALEGLTSTNGSDEITEFVGDGDVLTYDFPYFQPETGECPDPLDFETDAAGNPLAKGTIIAEQWASLGIHVTSHSSQHPVMVFDSAQPTGGDWDLGTPNQAFGGPGVGNGGKPGQPGENRNPLGKVLILSEDGHHWDPDDDADGGWMYFNFDSPVRIDSVQILDIEETGGLLKAYDASGNLIKQVPIPAKGDNSFQEIAVGAEGVSKFKVWFKGSGALAQIAYCPPGGGGGGGCPPVIDWEKDGQGNSLSKGTRITDQFAALGFQVLSHDPNNHPAMIFDSSFPTGGDKDLGTPNEDFGGPGKGNGGDAGSTYENRNAHGNVLILSEDNHHWDPDDDAGGGWVYFVFDTPVTVDWVQLLDIEESGGKIRTYNASGSLTNELSIPVIGDNGFVQVPVNKSGVSKLKVWLKGSGAIPAFSFCPGGGGGEPPAAPGTGTIGYWKNHPEAWPVDEVVIGGQTYSKSQAIQWMKKPSRGDKSIDLFKQLVAAVLNVEAGNESSCIDETIGNAQGFMEYVPVGSGLSGSHWAWRYIGAPLHEALDDYNNGLLCAPHRD